MSAKCSLKMTSKAWKLMTSKMNALIPFIGPYYAGPLISVDVRGSILVVISAGVEGGGVKFGPT